MAVTSQNPVVSYTASGSATVFPYPFLILLQTDISVYIDGILVESGYSVTGAGDAGGGDVIFTSPPPASSLVKLLRAIPRNRTTAYTEGGALRAGTLNDDFDRLVLMLQDVRADSPSLVEFEGVVISVQDDADAAALSAAAAAATLTDFETRYLGVKASAPILDNDGLPLVEGALYWNSVLKEMFVWNATAWVSFVPVQSTQYSAIIPAIPTADRDPTPAAGYFHFNNTLNQFEGYNGSQWGAVGGGATGGAGNYVFYENDQTVTLNYTLTAGKNAMTAGPISIASGVTVTIPSGATWSIV